MSHKTILLAVNDLLKKHPKMDEDYFKIPSQSIFDEKLLLARVDDGWEFIFLSWSQRLLHQFLNTISFGYVQLYGDFDLSSYKTSYVPVPENLQEPRKDRRFYEHLINKLIGPNSAWLNINYLLGQCELSYNKKFHSEVLRYIQENQKAVFHNLNELTIDRKLLLVRLLESDIKLFGGLWLGLMHFTNKPEFREINEVTSWIRPIFKALSLNQIKAAAHDAKFWEVVGSYPTEIAETLSLEQWECLVTENIEADPLGGLVLRLPVDKFLYDKLKLVCGVMPIDGANDLAMGVKFNQLNTFLKKHKDERSIADLKTAYNKSPVKKPPEPKPERPKSKFDTQPLPVISHQPSMVVKYVRPSISMWTQDLFAKAFKNPKGIIDETSKAISFFWAWMDKCSSVQPADLAYHQGIINYLITGFYKVMSESLDGMTDDETKLFLSAIEASNPKNIVVVFDAIMRPQGLEKEDDTLSRDNAERVFKHLTPELLRAAVLDVKLWTVLDKYSNLAGQYFTQSHMVHLAANTVDPRVLGIVISKLPQDKDLGRKLEVLCTSPKVNDFKLCLMTQINWFGNNKDKEFANKLREKVSPKKASIKPLEASSNSLK